MFYGCSSLSTLNLSNFNDNDVKNTKEILNNLNSKCIIITKNNEILRPFKKWIIKLIDYNFEGYKLPQMIDRNIKILL